MAQSSWIVRVVLLLLLLLLHSKVARPWLIDLPSLRLPPPPFPPPTTVAILELWPRRIAGQIEAEAGC